MSEQDELKTLLETLRRYVGTKNQPKCLELIGIIAEYVEGPLTESQLSEYEIT